MTLIQSASSAKSAAKVLWFHKFMSSWELIVDGAIDGGRNMAIDAALLDEVEGSREVQTIVRFYSWRRPENCGQRPAPGAPELPATRLDADNLQSRGSGARDAVDGRVLS